MFLQKLSVERIGTDGNAAPVPLRHLDSFAMRNFTNESDFDDTLPVQDGRLEVGLSVPLDRLRVAMEDWFRRKNYLYPNEHLQVRIVAPV